MNRRSATALSLILLTGAAAPALADEAKPAAPATPATPAPPAPTALATPAMSGPLAANSNPTKFDAGPLGTVYVTGVLSGVGQWQDGTQPGDLDRQADLSNGQVFVQKTTGLVQFYAQGGSYSIPDLGLPYVASGIATNALFGPFSQAFIKIAPNDTWSVEAGKLPTLIGAEYTFSFENANIERGLLWNQENAVNRGVQLNYSSGAIAASVSWNDGMYSNSYGWASGSLAYTFNAANVLSLVAGGNTRRTTVSTSATPGLLNNEQIYNIIYTHTAGPWTLEGYLQYTKVPAVVLLGAAKSSDTVGGAIFAIYAVPGMAGLSLPVRLEYIASSGSVTDGSPNLLYGPGSKAWSLTFTPTYQKGVFFARAELSYVSASSTTPGLVFGPNGTDTSQSRGLLEIGVLF
jgi:hypothetical protein